MKKLIIISTILLLSNLSFGQENKFSIGILSSFDKFDYDFKPITGFNHEYHINSAYSFGLNFKYNFAERLFTKGAIQYSKRGYKLNYDYNVMEPGDPLIPRETTIKLDYIGVPLFIGYNLYDGEKFKIAPTLGLVSELLISNNETSVFEDDSERESEFLNQNLNKFLISSQLNMAFDYHFSNKFFLSLEPFFSISINAIDNEIMESNSISYGGILSINYKLK
ncbi:MAG: PorT family protein [Prolixibacteraceae bacterium]|nr:PorT family protein [Prolixibacteraceae bacterium]